MPALPGHFRSIIQRPEQLRGVFIPAPPTLGFSQSPIPFSLFPIPFQSRPSHIKLELSFFPHVRTSIFRFTVCPKRGILLRHQFSIISFFREVNYINPWRQCFRGKSKHYYRPQLLPSRDSNQHQFQGTTNGKVNGGSRCSEPAARNGTLPSSYIVSCSFRRR